MKVLFDHPNPFLLAHGGFQIQIEQTRHALEACGADVEYLRWWDEHQEGDVIHFFGRPSPMYIRQAQEKGKRVVMSELLGGLGARPTFQRAVQRLVIHVARRILPTDFRFRMGWDAYQAADACVALTPWEARLMAETFSAPVEKIHIVPNGVEPVFFQSAPVPRGPWLVCTATVSAQKRLLELAQAAIEAQTPVWFIGKPYSESDPYVRRFLETARSHPQIIRYEGPIQDREKLARAYRAARGFVLLSQWESLSLSALEAAASGCPLLLGDLPWARSVFADHADYGPVTTGTRRTAQCLRAFYDAAPGRPAPPRPLTWLEVGRQLLGIYEGLPSTSR